jgi:hypothetical protein
MQQNHTDIREAEPCAKLPVKLLAGIAFSVILPISLPPSRSACCHNKSFAAAKSAPAGRELAKPAWRDIVPSEVIGPNAPVFIGTGDQSAGFWTRP